MGTPYAFFAITIIQLYVFDYIITLVYNVVKRIERNFLI